jgi:hypothetical protein
MRFVTRPPSATTPIVIASISGLIAMATLRSSALTVGLGRPTWRVGSGSLS